MRDGFLNGPKSSAQHPATWSELGTSATSADPSRDVSRTRWGKLRTNQVLAIPSRSQDLTIYSWSSPRGALKAYVFV
eukprot:7207604-Pyramimonas_sp.AAC.1